MEPVARYKVLYSDDAMIQRKLFKRLVIICILLFVLIIGGWIWYYLANTSTKWYMEGVRAFGYRNFPYAMECFNKSYSSDNKNTDALMMLARSHFEMRDFPPAFAMMDSVLTIVPNHDVYWGLLASMAYEAHDIDRAQAAIEKALATGGRKAEHLVIAARIELSQSRFSSAVELCAEALSKDPHNPKAIQIRNHAADAVKRISVAPEVTGSYSREDYSSEGEHIPPSEEQLPPNDLGY